MGLEAVKIPQNVSVEEKIIGPVSLRQIIICMVGGGISYAIWSSMKAAGSVTIVSTVIAWIPAMIAATFAFVHISDISLFRFLLLAIERSQKPSIRTWQPRRGIEITITVSGPKRPVSENAEEKRSRLERIEELSTLLDNNKVSTLMSKRQTRTAADADIKETSTAKPVNPARISTSVVSGKTVDSVLFGDRPQTILEEAEDDLVRDISPTP